MSSSLLSVAVSAVDTAVASWHRSMSRASLARVRRFSLPFDVSPSAPESLAVEHAVAQAELACDIARAGVVSAVYSLADCIDLAARERDITERVMQSARHNSARVYRLARAAFRAADQTYRDALAAFRGIDPTAFEVFVESEGLTTFVLRFPAAAVNSMTPRSACMPTQHTPCPADVNTAPAPECCGESDTLGWERRAAVECAECCR